jgi:flagellar motor switch protein FliN/FliY
MAEDAPMRWLAAEFAARISQVLESMAGEAPNLQFEEIQDIHSAGPDFLWWEQALSLGPHARIWIGAGQPAWEAIGARVLRSAGVEEQDPETSRSTYLEIVTQTLSGLASFLASRVQKEVSLDAGLESAPAASADCAGYSFQIGFPDQEIRILAAFTRALADAPPDPATTEKTQDAPAPRQPAAAPPPPNSIDLLLDVELPVSVSFGRAQLALKDVIKLTTGSIVELNRSISEPVEVIVNNCVIARGEVVVVEGNFGIRIKQVISRQERLRTLN